jgi:hypothetical protein
VFIQRVALPCLFVLYACGEDSPPPVAVDPPPSPVVQAPPPPPAPPALREPVPVFENGRVTRTVEAADAAREGLLLVDLGDEWVPFIFSEADSDTAPRVPNPYLQTYLALARGEYPDDHHGERAREDKYLELYGIPPTPTLLRTRLVRATTLECAGTLDLAPLRDFSGFISFEDGDRGVRNARRYEEAKRVVDRLLAARHVTDVSALPTAGLTTVEQTALRDVRQLEPTYRAIAATQARLTCEGFFEGRRRPTRGALDRVTHDALADFERMHRVFGWGFIGRDTLPLLKQPPADVANEDVVRVLLERVLHTAAVMEDGSVDRLPDGKRNTFLGRDGREHPVPNLEQALRAAIVTHFGLETAATTRAFFEALGEIGAHHWVAIPAVPMPEYHSTDMDLSIEIDRGDVWYEFPYDEQGRERAQPVTNRPRLTVFVTYNGRRFPIARIGTTIGGWRSDYVGDTLMWAYKGSPAGPVVWDKIVAAPVWLPPESSPPRGLLERAGGSGAGRYRVNRHETGPSYASAYGLVAAYHRPYVAGPNGTISLRGDQGIRSHGSVDYMSIMRRHSHGCHRLHNHMAVRLMSFVLRHRRFERRGEDEISYHRSIVVEGHTYSLDMNQGGYEYALVEPIRVEVLPGRVLGQVTTPIAGNLPRYDTTIGAYVLPDGGTVAVDRFGTITPVVLDGGVGDGGVVDAGASDARVPTNVITPLAHDAGVHPVPDIDAARP